MRKFNLLVLLVIQSFLASCVLSPSVNTDYDLDCKTATRQVQLTVERIEILKLQKCNGKQACLEGIVSQLVVATLAGPVSVIVSGSIAVVGNSVFWLVEKGHCLNNKLTES